MRSISKLFGAVGTLADSLLSLSALVDTISGRLRMQLALDTDPPQLPGEVIDGTTDSGTSARRKGKATA